MGWHLWCKGCHKVIAINRFKVKLDKAAREHKKKTKHQTIPLITKQYIPTKNEMLEFVNNNPQS